MFIFWLSWLACFLRSAKRRLCLFITIIPVFNCGEVSMCVLVWGRVCVCGVVWVWCVGRWWGGVYTRTYTVQSQALRSHVNFKPH